MDVQRENTYIRTYGRTHIHEHIYIPARICPYKNLKEGDETTVYLLCKCTAHVLRLLLLMCSLLSYRKLQEGDEIVSVNGSPINGRTPSDLKVHVVCPLLHDIYVHIHTYVCTYLIREVKIFRT